MPILFLRPSAKTSPADDIVSIDPSLGDVCHQGRSGTDRGRIGISFGPYIICALLATLLLQSSAFALQANLTWTDNSSSELGFKIERSSDSTAFTQIATVGANVTSFTDTGLSAGAYWYRVRAFDASSNSAYSPTVQQILSLPDVAPIITSQPSSQSASVGASVVLGVSSSGSPSPTFQWMKDGSPIAGANASSLTLAGVTLASNGSYLVTVTNRAGSVTSNAAVVTVAIPDSAPTISLQPTNVSAATGASISFAVLANGAPAPTYQWYWNDIAISGANSTSLSLTNVSGTNSGNYTVRVSNRAGSILSNIAKLTITAGTTTNVAPTVTTQPTSQIASVGGTVSFTVAGTGSPAPSVQWRKDGVDLPSATAMTLTIGNLSATNAGNYLAVLTNSSGSVTSMSAVLSLTSATAASSAPSFTLQPISQTVPAGSTVRFDALATGSPSPTIQWQKNGVSIPGATSPTLLLNSAGVIDGGEFVAIATNPVGSVSSRPASLTVNAAIVPDTIGDTSSRMANISVLAQAGTGSQTLIVGFVVAQNNKSVLLRAIGPGLSPYTVAPTFVDPKVTIFKGSSAMLINDNWGGGVAMKALFSQVGAFDLPDASKDAAINTQLSPGAYTAQISGTGAGLTLVELYDTDTASSSSGRLINLAARAEVGTGDDVLIAGFVISGTKPKQVMIRAIGPTLAALGVSEVLATPQIDLYRAGIKLQHSETWGGDAQLSAAFNKVGAFALPAASKDAVMLVTLDPGTYSTIISGVNNSKGVALIEVYEMP